ncbi:hypothetical protein AB0G20_21335 [Streptomyces sp. NPDC024017]|uniref:hypothetical protein n=1 Tax=Streptomyces sp. NPDC024017 TaxID=3154326 RepID=UPI0033E6AB14
MRRARPWVNRLDDTGWVREGALANLVVRDRDLFDRPAQEIAGTQVALTHVGAREYTQLMRLEQ